MATPQIKEEDHGKCHLYHKSNQFSQVAALSCRTYQGEENVCQGELGVEPLINPPLRQEIPNHVNLDC